MVNAGRVSIVPKGQFVFGTQYTRLDMVAYKDGIYVAKKDNISVYPEDDGDSEYWMFMMKLSPNTATSDGYVARGEGNPDETWATDGEGNPGWRKTVTGIKGNAEQEYRHGDVNITPDHIGAVTAKRAIVGQSGSTVSNPWYKFASIHITKIYSDPRISFKVSSAYSDNKYFGILSAHIRTKSPVALESGILVWEYASSNIDTSKFVLAYKSISDESVDVELWCKIDDQYRYWFFEVIDEGNRTTHEELWAMHSASSAGQSAEIPPEYTQIPSTVMSLKNVLSLSGGIINGNIYVQSGYVNGTGQDDGYVGEIIEGVTISGSRARVYTDETGGRVRFISPNEIIYDLCADDGNFMVWRAKSSDSSFNKKILIINKNTNDATFAGRVMGLPFDGTDGMSSGTVGLVPAPKPEDKGKVLCSNGEWISVDALVMKQENEQLTECLADLIFEVSLLSLGL